VENWLAANEFTIPTDLCASHSLVWRAPTWNGQKKYIPVAIRFRRGVISSTVSGPRLEPAVLEGIPKAVHFCPVMQFLAEDLWKLSGATETPVSLKRKEKTHENQPRHHGKE
jgi:hypothetical protein